LYVLGINAYHGDAAACLVVDGELVAAIEEERIRRVKHWAGLPTEAIRWCLDYAGLRMAEIDHIAIGRDPSAHLSRKLMFALRTFPTVAVIRDRIANMGRVRDIKSSICSELEIDLATVRAPVHQVEHHRAHLASAFFPSKFDEAVCVSLDCFGDFASTMVGVGRGGRIDVRSWIGFPDSLGALYTAGTQYLGFERYGDEYKVMGLAPYGEPEFRDALRACVRLKKRGVYALDLKMFRHHREIVDTRWEGGAPELGPYFSNRWDERFGRRRATDEPIEDRHRNVACSLQAVAEEVYFHVLRPAAALRPGAPLCLAGGCAQNSVANGKIRRDTPFVDLYVPPATGDAGTAVGAALWVWHHELGGERRSQPDHAFLGPAYSDEAIRRELDRAGLRYCAIDDESELVERTAERIDRGQVVGWFQGRSEWGPRALGNRSLLADPRRPEMRDLINERIKRREAFRPFAPAVLVERAGDWFETSHAVPFMSEVQSLREPARSQLPAVTHVDGTGRLQTVNGSPGSRFRLLLEAFERKTGTPVLLNTSFNENEPIVNRPQEAIDCYRRTEMDALVIGTSIVSRDDLRT
jgi:carbamoyltransferase